MTGKLILKNPILSKAITYVFGSTFIEVDREASEFEEFSTTEAIVILLVVVLSNAPLLTRLWEIAEGFTNRSVNKGTALT